MASGAAGWFRAQPATQHGIDGFAKNCNEGLRNASTGAPEICSGEQAATRQFNLRLALKNSFGLCGAGALLVNLTQIIH